MPMGAYARPLDDVDPERALVSIAKETPIYARPTFKSKRIGYLRAGAVVSRHAEASGFGGCTRGFYQIRPEGYVCVGKTASLDTNHLLVSAIRRRPDRSSALPYYYGISKFPTPPFYTRIPTAKDQATVEQELHYHKAHYSDKSWADVPVAAVPEFLSGGQSTLSLNGYRHSRRYVHTGRAIPKSGLALVDLFESGGRQFGLTVDMAIVPIDRMTRVSPSRFHGLPLSDEVRLPVIFNMSRSAYLYEGDPKEKGLKISRKLDYREAVPVSGKRVRAGGMTYLETTSGDYLIDRRLVRVNPFKKRPSWATPGRTWLNVSILNQTLTAYEGGRPVFVTLVSTGADGLGDPEETHSTVRGRFLVHTKHVTITMSGAQVGDEFDLRDVPYVQYFSAGYALHAAYWHDSFGHPRSHGCVNLSPLDAQWLFGWTDPPVPSKWHGGMSLLDGTLVSIHP